MSTTPPPPQPPPPPTPPLPPANTLLTLSVSCQTDATTHRALAQLAATGPSPVSHPWPVLDMVVGDRGFVVGVPLLHRFTVVDVINITSIVPPNPATITVEQHYGWLSAAPPALKKALTTPAAVDALAASIDRLRQLGLVLAVPIAFPDGGDVIGVRREVRVSWADGRAYASAVIDAAVRYNGVAFAVFLDALRDGGVQIASGAVAATQSNQPPAGEAADTAAAMSADSLRAAFVSLRGAIIVALRDGVGPRLRCIGEAGRGAARLPGGNAVAATGPAFPTTHLDACAAFTPPTTPDAPRPARPPSPPCTPSTSVVDLGTLPATFYLPATIPADDPRSAVASQLYAAPPAPRSPSLASIMKANGLHPDINTRLCMMHSVLAYAAFGRAVAGECVRPEAGASRSPCDAVVSMTDALSLSVTDVLRVAVGVLTPPGATMRRVLLATLAPRGLAAALGGGTITRFAHVVKLLASTTDAVTTVVTENTGWDALEIVVHGVVQKTGADGTVTNYEILDEDGRVNVAGMAAYWRAKGVVV